MVYVLAEGPLTSSRRVAVSPFAEYQLGPTSLSVDESRVTRCAPSPGLREFRMVGVAVLISGVSEAGDPPRSEIVLLCT